MQKKISIFETTPANKKTQLFTDLIGKRMSVKAGIKDEFEGLRFQSGTSNEEWNPNGYKDSRGLYVVDRMHLNEKGYADSDSIIVKVILDNLCK